MNILDREILNEFDKKFSRSPSQPLANEFHHRYKNPQPKYGDDACRSVVNLKSILLSLFHPTGIQRWLRVQAFFVHKEEFELVSEALFSYLFQQLFCLFFPFCILRVAQTIFRTPIGAAIFQQNPDSMINHQGGSLFLKVQAQSIQNSDSKVIPIFQKLILDCCQRFPTLGFI